MNPNTRILRVEQHEPDCAVLWMDDPDESVNTLKRELIEEFAIVMDHIEAMTELKVLVFASAKPDNFIAGANLDMLSAVKSPAEATSLSQTAQQLQARIARLQAVTVAAIHGNALGGGLEFALAFDQRVASEHAKTRLGFPEVQLGLLPGGGGTQLATRLIGVEKALDMLLTGRQITAQRARRIGLVDELVPHSILVPASIKRGREFRKPAEGRTDAKKWLSVRHWRNWALGGNPLGRRIVFDQARKRTLQQTRGNYPAPERILDVVRTGLEQGMTAGLRAEAEAFGELVLSPQAQQLIYLFFASTALKKDTGLPSSRTTERREVKKLGVLGAGLMGAGIAFTSLNRTQAEVRIKDRDNKGIAHGLRHIHEQLQQRVRRRSITSLQKERALAHLSTTTDYSGLQNCELVIEAVFEDLQLKRQILEDIETRAKVETIFASNTSALPIGQIAAQSRYPERVIGMHYFSPVEKMPLLEIVAGEKTADWVISTCVAFGKKQGKTVIVVKDGPGFYTTRILAAYMNEAAHLLSEGTAIDAVDRALLDFGFPLGPMALLDEVGIDVAQKVAHTMTESFGERMQVDPGLARLLEDDRLGKKNGKGLFLYKNKNESNRLVDESVYSLLGVTPNSAISDQQIAERCVLQMVNEALYCLEEGILRSPREGDIGAVFGLGFPPFLGGPFRYVDTLGPKIVLEKLDASQSAHGSRFKPAALLQQYARSGEKFSTL